MLSAGPKCAGNGACEPTKWNVDLDATAQPATSPCPRLVGRTSGYLHDHTPAMTSANWNHHLALELD
ncbi:hypothetical protein K443DRAFT_542765 [Laccaria amethystina LaAM-08-1]|uniref:Uncharacterized protein n=1 Tax=Laccaria amethystina LaAM-08-1 TaxID=1095629 RepID=A0A0C9XAZ2_9AGAR|nr:hypothetical protein K443DRAFT_542765 [Laccaria amethystina LaAM-08-1]